MSELQGAFALLVDRVRAGDNLALDQLAKQIAAPLHRAANRLIGKALQPHLDSGDLVQQVLIDLWRGLRKGKFAIATPKQLLSLSRILLRRTVARQWRAPQADHCLHRGRKHERYRAGSAPISCSSDD